MSNQEPTQKMVPPGLQETPAVKAGRAFTFRALLAGASGSLIIAVGVPYGTYVVRGSYMDLDYSTPAAIFLLLILSLGVNTLLRRVSPPGRSWALSPPELIVAYIMMAVACTLPVMGFTAQVLPTITAPFYFANSGNRWEEIIQPHLPAWLAPRDPVVVREFFEGMRRAGDVPWGAWVVPIASWLAFLIPFHFACLCMMVLLRRQWCNRERLAYPLTHLPIEMVAGCGPGPRPLYRNPLLWIGFAIPFALGSMKALHQYFPTFPTPVLETSFPMFRNLMRLQLRVSFPMVGFFYLVNLDTTFSLWFFNLLAFCIRGVMAIMAVEYKESLGPYGTPSPIFAHLGMGAMIVLVFSGLWYARPHLREVWRTITGRPGGADDSGEVLSYRMAFIGMCAGVLCMGAWLWMAGMPLPVIPVLLVAAFVLFIGLTRVVVESGLAEAVASTTAMGFSVSSLGTAAFGPKGLVALGLCYVWAGDLRTLMMTSTANSLRMGELARPSRRPLVGAIFLAILIGLFGSLAMTLFLAYKKGGGLNLNNWFFVNGPQSPWRYVADRMNNPTGVSGSGLLLESLGAGVMLFLTIMRQRHVWWPFHPIGFAVGTTWIMDQIWLSALICWALKLGIVRFGGLRAFRTARPIFLGLILGQFTCNGMWLIIDSFTGMKGNQIFWI